MSELATQSERQIARPLAVLVPLIQEDLKQAKEATERAGVPYYKAAGEKMLEAKGQLSHGEFEPWIKRHFGITRQQAARYMEFANATASMQKERTLSFSSLNDFHRQTGSPHYRSVTSKREWHEPVKQDIERARREADQLAQRRRDETLTRQQERAAEQKLGLRLIDIGYKILVKELHPDKGGSRDAMSRLNRVRDRLKMHA